MEGKRGSMEDSDMRKAQALLALHNAATSLMVSAEEVGMALRALCQAADRATEKLRQSRECLVIQNEVDTTLAASPAWLRPLVKWYLRRRYWRWLDMGLVEMKFRT